MIKLRWIVPLVLSFTAIGAKVSGGSDYEPIMWLAIIWFLIVMFMDVVDSI